MLHNILMIIASVLMVTSGVAMYWAGENKDKIFKYLTGIPIGVIGALAMWSWWPLLAIPTYFIASWAFGYGTKNPWTKWFGNAAAITITGAALGLASLPLIGAWCVLQALISAGVWYWLHTKNGVINEPYVAIYRALGGLCLILLLFR
jgi:hypothetical protein